MTQGVAAIAQGARLCSAGRITQLPTCMFGSFRNVHNAISPSRPGPTPGELSLQFEACNQIINATAHLFAPRSVFLSTSPVHIQRCPVQD